MPILPHPLPPQSPSRCHPEPRRRPRDPLPKHEDRSVGRGSLDFARDDTVVKTRPDARSSSATASRLRNKAYRSPPRGRGPRIRLVRGDRLFCAEFRIEGRSRILNSSFFILNSAFIQPPSAEPGPFQASHDVLILPHHLPYQPAPIIL